MSRRSLILFFLIFLVIKLGVSFNYTKSLFCRNPEIKSGKITAFTGDSFSYTGAMENYITKGEYYFEFNGNKVYAGRVPHYSVPYYLFRSMFDKSTSLDLSILLQLVLEAIAFFLISLIIFEITKSKLTFFLSLLFSIATFFYTHYTLIPITDSPAAALLAISFWFLFRYLNSTTPNFKNWVFFSLFLALATILRPYFGLIFILVVVILFFKYKVSFIDIFKKCFAYGAILLLFLAPWIIRNYSQSGRIILFQQDKYAGYDISKELELTRQMLAAIGEDASTMWDKTTAAGYFSRASYKNSTWQVPPRITSDSILNSNFYAIRNLCIDSIDDKTQSVSFKTHYTAFIDRYKSTNKLNYYLFKYISRIKKFLINSGSYYYSYNAEDGCSSKIDYFLKVGQSLFYYLCLIPGFIGLLWLARIKKFGLVFLSPTVSLLLVFPIILGLIEWRYFLPFYFFHQIGLFFLFHRLFLSRIRSDEEKEKDIASTSFEVFIEPGRGERNYWKDLWRYRELFYILSWRDLKVRYKQTVIGVVWSVLRPLLTMTIFTFVFGNIAKFQPPEGVKYAVLVFAGLLPWQFFSAGLSEASNSLIGNEKLISKVYFPRMIIPAASVITSLVDFFISLVLMFGLMIWYGVAPSVNLILLPLFIIVAFFASFGVGLWLTALNVKYRDFKHVVPFLVQIGLYLSPVGFTSDKASTIIPEKFRMLYYLNPMAGVIDGFRWCFFGDKTPIYWPGMFISLIVIILFMLIGIRTFRKMEKNFADLI